ncbi:MAG: hypothetical protein CVV39_06020 [Planctomycetes bacterium HGW-Planctomycetes-1]|nr:MAG: hypothetical protein CVV39_06020 [Planctomycetes bacterium HGW-Planctomycetes-1]
MSGLFDPKIWWFEQLPSNLRPNESKVKELEKLRSHAIFHIFPLPNDMFTEIILSSRWVVHRVQENVYMRAKEKMPDASEKELLETVFRSRLFPQNPAGLEMTEEEFDKEMRNINSLNDLIQYFVQRDKEISRFCRDIFGIGKRIAKKVDDILDK